MLPPDFTDRFAAVCAERIAPRAADADTRGLDPESLRDLAAVGYLGLFHPVDHGGLDADGATLARAMETLAGACAGTFWAATISSLLCGKMLTTLCGPEQARRWLRPLLEGRALGAFAATEDAAGSDPGSYRAAVIRTPDGPRLVGRKSRISNAVNADVAVVFARDGAPDAAGLCYVVVDLNRPGVTRREEPKMGLGAMSWGSIDFDVPVDPADIVAGADVQRTLVTVEWGQLLQAWCAIGVAERAFRLAAAHAAERTAFGGPIGRLDVVRGRLAGMRAEIDAARLLATEATVDKHAGRPARETVLMSKVYATEMVLRVTDGAMRTLGGWGYARGHLAERLHRDALANWPAGLPTDRLRELLGCAIVGADPWVYPTRG